MLLLAAALTGACGIEERTPAPPGSTLRATVADRDGDGDLGRGPAEPLLDRTELAPRGEALREVARFGQLSDTHVRDEESPARVPFLDRLGPPFASTFRPHEALSTQVLTAAVRAMTAERPRTLLLTGDLIDSAQRNELDQFLAVVRGGEVDPDSGGTGYRGVQQDADPVQDDLLARAQRPYFSPGVRVPWLPAIGEHDVLVQGEQPPSGASTAIATGSLLSGRGRGEPTRVPADPRRRHLRDGEAARVLRRAAGLRGAPAGGRLDYAASLGPAVRVIVLDTATRTGGAAGSIGPRQVAFLRRELRRAGDRSIVVVDHHGLDRVAGGAAARALLARDPRVVAELTGDRHRNEIRPVRTAAGGYWRIATSSLADWPQQGRMLRLVTGPGGSRALETWMVDQAGSLRAGDLPGAARELAFLDAQGGRPQGFAGGRADRNARLYVR